jgi:hypothetical protein
VLGGTPSYWYLGAEPFKVFNENTLFQCDHPEFSAQILGFLKVEITNLRSKFHHLERASPSLFALRLARQHKRDRQHPEITKYRYSQPFCTVRKSYPKSFVKN